jgi:hypothetical protein
MGAQMVDQEFLELHAAVIRADGDHDCHFTSGESSVPEIEMEQRSSQESGGFSAPYLR